MRIKAAQEFFITSVPAFVLEQRKRDDRKINTLYFNGFVISQRNQLSCISLNMCVFNF